MIVMKTRTLTIGNTEYTYRRIGALEYQRMIGSSTTMRDGVPDASSMVPNMFQYCMLNVVVTPKLTLADLDDPDQAGALTQLYMEITRVFQELETQKKS